MNPTSQELKEIITNSSGQTDSTVDEPTEKSDYLVIDVRDDDYVGGNITGSKNFPSKTFRDSVDDLVRDSKEVKKVVFHCALSKQR